MPLGRSRALLALACAFALMSQAAAQEWREIGETDGRFRVELPGASGPVDQPEQENGLPVLRRSWAGEGKGGQPFDFDYARHEPGALREPDAAATARDLGRGFVDTAFPRPPHRYTLDAPVAIAGFPGYALDVERPDGMGIAMRTYVVRDRVYRLLVAFGPDPESRAAAKRFVDSFQVFEPAR